MRSALAAQGTFLPSAGFVWCLWEAQHRTEPPMHGLIYLIGLIVVIMAILSFFGLR
jgi:hypothetical protein